MIAVVLCAGFATRMYPLTRDVPKPLLPVVDKPVIDYLIDQLVDLPGLKAAHIVSNDRFFDHFRAWQREHTRAGHWGSLRLVLHNDGATANANRLGAAADLQWVLARIPPTDRLLVSAGDNIFRFRLAPLWQRFLLSEGHWVVALPETDPDRLKRTGVLELGENDRVLKLHEKPPIPPSAWCCPPLYLLRGSARAALDAFIEASDTRDAPGHFIDYLCRRESVHAIRLNAFRLDIGSLEIYRRADTLLRRDPLFPETA